MNKTKATTKSQSASKAHVASKPGTPIANLQKAARRAKDEGELAAEGARIKATLKAENDERAAASRKTKDEGDLQAEKFAKVARDLGADQDEEAFKGVLRKLGKPAR